VNPRTKQIAIALAALLLSLLCFLATRPKTDNANHRLTSPAKPKPRTIQASKPAPAHSIPPPPDPDPPAPIAAHQPTENTTGLTGKVFNDDGEVSDEFFDYFSFSEAQRTKFSYVIEGVTHALQIIESRRVEVLSSTDGSSRFIIHPFHSLGQKLAHEIPEIFKRINAQMPDAAIDYLMTEATSDHEDFFAGFGQYPREFQVVRDGTEYVMTETRILPGTNPGELIRTNGPVRRFTKPPKRYAHLFLENATTTQKN